MRAADGADHYLPSGMGTRDSLVTTLLVYVPPRAEILRQVAELILG